MKKLLMLAVAIAVIGTAAISMAKEEMPKETNPAEYVAIIGGTELPQGECGK